jgi:tetratricopeptide (TPR) repeat protein
MRNNSRLLTCLILFLSVTGLSHCGADSTSGDGGDSWRGGLLTFALFALVIVVLIRDDWFHRLSMNPRKSEKKARQEVKIRMDYDRAVLAEKGENFDKAASFYEEVLSTDPTHLQARFNLARIYHNRLGDQVNAHLHFRKLVEHAPQEHPYRREAKDVLNRPIRNKGRSKYDHGHA